MGRTWVRAVLAVVLVLGAIAGMYALMLHGYLELTAYLLIAAVGLMALFAVVEWRRHQPRMAALLLVGALITGGTVGWYGWNLNAKLDNIARARDDALDKGKRPQVHETGALNILLMGADDPNPEANKPSISELLVEGDWNPGAYRSDTMMVVHIPADRKSAYVVSIPRDSYVPIYDPEGQRTGEAKINAAFSETGPFGTWRTVENLTGLRMDHMAIVDLAGFRDLTTAIGGVDVYVPEETVDTKQDITWTKGWHHIEGDLALKYVRQRYGLSGGDFDRVDRQQNFLRAVMNKTLADDTIGNPAKFTDTIEAITQHLTVDEGWTNGQIRGLALDLRGLSSDKVTFLTAPFGSFDTVDGASIVRLDPKASRQLWKAVADDDVAGYLAKHPDDELGDPENVS